MAEIAYIRATGIFDDSRATKEILTLGKAGHTIHVLSWDRYGNAEAKNRNIFKDCPNIDFLYFEEHIPNGIGMKNIFKLLSWFRWIKKTLNGYKTIDAVHACNLDTAIPALEYCKKTKCRLIYDIYDYYIDSHAVPSFLEREVEKKEIAAIDYADVTIICTEERMEQISKANPRKVVVIYNSPDIEKSYNNDILYDYVYCGALSSKRLIGEILDEYPEHSGLKFYFAGYGEYSKKCLELAERFPNFTYDEPIPYEKVLEMESRSRCLSAIYEPSVRNHRLCAPNKFYEALALGKPIIVCEGTGIDRVILENDCGKVIPYDSKCFYTALNDICLSNHNSQKQQELFKKKYKWSIMERRLLSIYECQ